MVLNMWTTNKRDKTKTHLTPKIKVFCNHPRSPLLGRGEIITEEGPSRVVKLSVSHSLAVQSSDSYYFLSKQSLLYDLTSVPLLQLSNCRQSCSSTNEKNKDINISSPLNLFSCSYFQNSGQVCIHCPFMFILCQLCNCQKLFKRLLPQGPLIDHQSFINITGLCVQINWRGSAHITAVCLSCGGQCHLRFSLQLYRVCPQQPLSHGLVGSYS